MTVEELIGRFRTLANDKALPYFWSDDEVLAWLNDALCEAVLRGRLLHKCDVALPVPARSAAIGLPENLYELDCVQWECGDDKHAVPIVSPEYANYVRGVCVVQTDTALHVYPPPNRDGVLWLSGYALPEMLQGDDDVPEIHDIHHVHLLDWVLHKAFSVPDAEVFDPQRSAMAEQAFTQYFGMRPDSDLRRITREDVPHSVVPFWI